MLMTRRDEGEGDDDTDPCIEALGFDGWGGEVWRVKPKRTRLENAGTSATSSKGLPGYVSRAHQILRAPKSR